VEDTLRHQLTGANDKVNQLMGDIAALRHTTQWAATESQLKHEALQREYESVKAELSRKDAETVAMAANFAESKAQVMALQAAANTSLTDLQKELRKAHSKATTDSEQARQDIATQKRRADAAERKVRQLEGTARSLRNSVNRLTEEVTRLREGATVRSCDAVCAQVHLPDCIRATFHTTDGVQRGMGSPLELA